MAKHDQVPTRFRRVRQITFPTLSIDAERPYFIRFRGAIFTGSPPPIKADGKQEKAAQIAQVVNMETGEEMQIVVGTVLERQLQDNYPNDSYVDKCFEIVKHAPEDGVRYATYDVFEVASE